jgi:AAHS family 4-hydroxybenzoate transporter-like MFS transporter
MHANETLDVRQFMDSRPVSGYQKLVVFLGFLIIALDGFDVAIMGFIAPQLRTEWGISHTALGPVLSAALFGLAIGAMASGPIADRYGRKIVLVYSVLFFGLWTLAMAAFAHSVQEIVIYRFLTGIGLGAAMPNAATLVSEFAPARSRSFLITVAFCGFTFGAAGGGFLSAYMIPALGWRSVIWLGGIMPVILAPLLLARLPESVCYLLARRAPAARIHAIMDRLAPGAIAAGASFVLPPVSSQSSVQIVVSRSYRFGTMMLWTGYFMVLFLIYLFSGWLPTLVKEGGGYSMAQAAIVAALFQIGGTVGSLALGWIMDRWNAHRVLALTFAIGAGLTFAIGIATRHFALTGAIAFGIGFCMNGGSVGMNALSAAFYPTEARATGSSSMSGVGRFGAILSAFAGAQMLSTGWSFMEMFAALAIPGLLAAAAMFAKGRAQVRNADAPASYGNVAAEAECRTVAQ